VITVGKGGAILTSSTPIKVSATVNSSGLPVPVGAVGNSAEIPVMDAMKFDAASKAVFNAGGLDSEAIVVDAKRNALWVSDEYGPFIVKLDAATASSRPSMSRARACRRCSPSAARTAAWKA
jgi:hypothetical protein